MHLWFWVYGCGVKSSNGFLKKPLREFWCDLTLNHTHSETLPWGSGTEAECFITSHLPASSSWTAGHWGLEELPRESGEQQFSHSGASASQGLEMMSEAVPAHQLFIAWLVVDKGRYWKSSEELTKSSFPISKSLLVNHWLWVTSSRIFHCSTLQVVA